MSKPGEFDPLYILARTTLLDALEALGEHRDAIVLIGAQAVYLHTGPAGLSVAEYTTDADLAIHPELLSDSPLLEEAMRKANFELHATQVGRWVIKKSLAGEEVEVMADLLVPEALGGGGSRGARLGVHGKRAARKAKGLEAALIDNKVMKIESLVDKDSRTIEISVAGPTALLIAKMHKIGERIGDGERAKNKDALDVLRLLRAVSPDVFSTTLRKLSKDEVAGAVTREAIEIFDRLFRTQAGEGAQMAARALEYVEPTATTTASAAALTEDVFIALEGLE